VFDYDLTGFSGQVLITPPAVPRVSMGPAGSVWILHGGSYGRSFGLRWYNSSYLTLTSFAASNTESYEIQASTLPATGSMRATVTFMAIE
jgi:hypothetical protein